MVFNVGIELEGASPNLVVSYLGVESKIRRVRGARPTSANLIYKVDILLLKHRARHLTNSEELTIAPGNCQALRKERL